MCWAVEPWATSGVVPAAAGGSVAVAAAAEWHLMLASRCTYLPPSAVAVVETGAVAVAGG